MIKKNQLFTTLLTRSEEDWEDQRLYGYLKVKESIEKSTAELLRVLPLDSGLNYF